jgi:hypothetical protein
VIGNIVAKLTDNGEFGCGWKFLVFQVLLEFSGDFSLDDLRGKKRARKLLEGN